MTTTHNQEILHIQDESKKHRENIQRVTLDIASTNSKCAIFEANVKDEFTTDKGELASLTIILNQWLKQSHGSPSSEQSSHYEGEESSHTMAFCSNSLPHDPRFPRVEVKILMGQIPHDGSLKWKIISPYTELLMSWPNITMVSSI
jgi:hypothetical protein